MSEATYPTRPENNSWTAHNFIFFRSSVIALILLLVATWSFQAVAQEEEYSRIFNVVQEADGLAAKQPDKALTKYREAYAALEKLRTNEPKWNSDMVTFRLKYVGEKIQKLTEKPAEPAESKDKASGTEGTATAASGAAAAKATQEVKLLEAGAEPKKALRFQPKEGETQTLTMQMDIKMDM